MATPTAANNGYISTGTVFFGPAFLVAFNKTREALISDGLITSGQVFSFHKSYHLSSAKFQ